MFLRRARRKTFELPLRLCTKAIELYDESLNDEGDDSTADENMDVEISDMVETDEDLNDEDFLERELRSVSSSEAVPQNKDTNIPTAFKTWETTKQRLRRLEIVYNSLCIIQPTSVEAGRAFSAKSGFNHLPLSFVID